MKTRSRFMRMLAPALLALAAFGCSATKSVAPPPVDPHPSRDTPAGVVKRLEWDWQHLDAADYATLLTGDFRFVPAAGDSAGSGWTNENPWNREIERLVTTRMFDPAPSEPPSVNDLVLNLDRTMISLPDPRPGKHPKWHRTIRTHVDLKVEVGLGGGSIDAQIVTGNAFFYLVRGDSAVLTLDQQWEGATHDSTQWWIERWEDETLEYGGFTQSPTPTRNLTWAAIKLYFLPSRLASR
jgi:hypothetical protein